MKKSRRFQEYISHYYRFLYIFGLKPEREHTFVYLFSLAVFAFFVVLYVFEMAPDNAFVQVLKFVLQFLLSGTLALGLFVAGVWLRISADDEVLRVDKSKFTAIPPENVHRIFRSSEEVSFQHDMSTVSRPSEVIQILLNTIEIDTESYYRIHAGSLDIPKVAFAGADVEAGIIRTNIASFRDIFFTHYFLDFPLSRSSSGENKAEANTLRSLVGPEFQRHYARQGTDITVCPGLPSPLGVTGSVRLRGPGDQVIWILQKRGAAAAADRSRLQMGYAGIIDAVPFFSSGSYSITELIRVELDDEVLLPLFNADPAISCRHVVLGICFNPNFLFQPELLVHTEIDMEQAHWDALKKRPIYSTADLTKNTIRVGDDELVLVKDDGWLTSVATDNRRVREIDIVAARLLNEWLQKTEASFAGS